MSNEAEALAQVSLISMQAIMLDMSALLKRANINYRQGKPSGMSDHEYDRAERALEHLEAAYPQFIHPESPVGKVNGGYKA